MLPLYPGEFASMRETTHASFLDRCTHLIWSPGEPDEFGQHPEGGIYTEGESYPCGFGPTETAARETQTGDALVSIAVAAIRLPRSAPVGPNDRLRLTHRTYTALASPIDFEVTSDAVPGPTALVVEVRRVTTTTGGAA